MRALATATALVASIASAQPGPVFTSKNVEAKPVRFPVRIPKEGPLDLQLQILLDKSGFSPGIIDGAWGINAAKAMTFFTEPDDTKRLTGDSPPPVTTVDKATYDRLRAAARGKPLLRRYTIVRADVAGPFTTIPEDVYKQARLDCLCYTSPVEQLSERFHVSRKLLAKLNPRVNLEALKPGVKLLVPNVELDGSAVPQDTAIIARVIISKKHFWTHAVDANGKIIYHFPSTLGNGYLSAADESPTGGFHITNISWNPAFHYQPTLFADVSDKKPEAHLPKGPNSPVGVVWMALSKPHFGIHGTSAPETIGYSNSHGCVRLTNWDALELGRLVSKGTPVVFQ